MFKCFHFFLRLNFLIILFASIFFAASGTAPSGKFINYNPTKVRQGDDVTAATGAFTMRGQSKAANRFIDKELKAAGKAGEDGRTIIKNVGDQHSAIYKAPGFKGNPTDAKIDSVFNKNVLGAPTTTNIPKGAVPDASKKIDAKSIIRKFKRKKK